MVKHTQTIRRQKLWGLKKGIAYSQALCVKRISSINPEFEAYINKIQDQVV